MEVRACYFSLFLNEADREGAVCSAWLRQFAFEGGAAQNKRACAQSKRQNNDFSALTTLSWAISLQVILPWQRQTLHQSARPGHAGRRAAAAWPSGHPGQAAAVRGPHTVPGAEPLLLLCLGISSALLVGLVILLLGSRILLGIFLLLVVIYRTGGAGYHCCADRGPGYASSDHSSSHHVDLFSFL